MESYQHVVLILLVAQFALAALTNYVSNGGFSVQALPASSYLLEGATNWTGYQYETMNLYTTLGYGQYVDLQYATGTNGYIQQDIMLPENGDYNLSFMQQAISINYLSYVMEVYWNGQLIATQIANTTSPTLQTFVLAGIQGVNVLKFNEIGSTSDGNGMFLDEVSLVQIVVAPKPVPPEQGQVINKNILQIIAAVLFTSVSHASGLRYTYLLAEDLWLYYYDIIEHEDILEVVFNTTVSIELMKMAILDRFLGWNNFSSNLPLSDYLPYTRQRFIEVENSSSVLIKAVFPFFVYSIPSNILLCLLLRLLFLLLRQYRVSKFLRRFYFLKTALLQTMLEGNVIYFVYVCFGHLATAFHFRLADKLSLLFTVLFLWVIFVFTFAFYPLVGHYLKKKAGYFMYCYYRCNSGYFYLTAKNLARNFLRGAVFYFLHENYWMELILLSFFEVMLLAITIYMQSMHKVFISKAFHFLWLTYHSVFVFLNFSLYFIYACNTIYNNAGLKQVALQIQQVAIHLLIVNIILIMILDLVPLEWIKQRPFLLLLLNNFGKLQKQSKNIKKEIIANVHNSKEKNLKKIKGNNRKLKIIIRRYKSNKCLSKQIQEDRLTGLAKQEKAQVKFNQKENETKKWIKSQKSKPVSKRKRKAYKKSEKSHQANFLKLQMVVVNRSNSRANY